MNLADSNTATLLRAHIPPPEAVLQHFDAIDAPCEAVRLALRDVTASEQTLLDERLCDSRIAAAVRNLMRMQNCKQSHNRSSEETAVLTAAEATAAAGLFAWLRGIFPADAAPPMDASVVFGHWLATALAARALAASEPRFEVRPNEAFLAGLMHDIGKAAIRTIFPRSYRRIIARNEELRGDLVDQERSVLGIDHTTAGRYLAERWALPRGVRDVIWLHHLSCEVLPVTIARPYLLKLIRLADTMAREARVGYSGNYRLTETSTELAGRLAIDGSSLTGVTQRLAEETNHLLARVLRESEWSAEKNEARSDPARSIESGSAEKHHVMGAIREFDRSCGDEPNLRTVAHSLAAAAAAALHVPCACAFTLSHAAVLSVAVFDRDSGVRDSAFEAERRISQDDLRALSTCAAEVVPTPRSIREQLADALREIGAARSWLIPLQRAGVVLGGILVPGGVDESETGRRAVDAFRLFRDHATRVLGLILDCRNAQRLSDDLAEANRRMQHMQHELLRNKALSMIAEMAAGAGHELNSPLAVISGRAQMLARQCDDVEVRRSLEIISEKAHECSQIVSELMDFARPRAPQPVDVDLAERIREFAFTWASEIALPTSRLTVSVPAHLPMVSCDPEQIDAVMRELLRNAANAIAMNGGQIFITGRVSPLGDGVEVSIRDTGCGMSSMVSQRAFDPFYSHRDAGRGRGLGLPRVHRIIEAHGGRIWLESTSDEGTTARFFLPMANRGETDAAPTAARRVS